MDEKPKIKMRDAKQKLEQVLLDAGMAAHLSVAEAIERLVEERLTELKLIRFLHPVECAPWTIDIDED